MRMLRSIYYEFSIMVVRKSVISIPAVLTIFGTSDAAVIPGIVFTSRKYSPSLAQI